MTTGENIIHFIQGEDFQRESETHYILNILKANCQRFCLTQFVRLYFVLPCTLSLTVFVWLNFVLRPQVFQPVPLQPYSSRAAVFRRTVTSSHLARSRV